MPAIVILLSSLLVLIVGSRLIVNEVSVLSKLLHSSLFGVSVLLLGFLTSLPELSVAIQAEIDQKPQIYAGNLMGGVFLLLTGIIPLFAYVQNGISLKRNLQPPGLFLFVSLLSLPLLAGLNGIITRPEAVVLILGYAVFMLGAKPVSLSRVKKIHISRSVLVWKVTKIVFASVAIYVACTQLVAITEASAHRFGAPTFLISFIALALGTNIPELTLALQAIFRKKSAVAFGDYIGSAAANPLILGVFSLYHGPYVLGIDKLLWVLGFFMLANILFFFFALSQNKLSKKEAFGLLALYVAMAIVQLIELQV